MTQNSYPTVNELILKKIKFQVSIIENCFAQNLRYETDRDYIGFEINKEYIEMAMERLKPLQEQSTLRCVKDETRALLPQDGGNNGN